MSSLTEEQKRRIEENRARALAKLAEKKCASPSQHSVSAGSFAMTLSCSNHSSSSTSSFLAKSRPNGDHCTQKRAVDFSRFQYRRGSNKNCKNSSQNSSSKPHSYTKSVNNVLSKSQIAKGTCVLMSKTRFKVVVGFHAKLVGVLKSLPSRCYDAQTRTWNFLLEDYEHLMTLCKPLAEEVTLSGLPKGVLRLFLSNQSENLEKVSETEICWDLIEKKLVDSLLPFQREGVVFSIKKNGRVLLADDMGLGKTIQAIAVASYYKDKWPLLVVVPSSLRMTWRRAFIRWLPSLQPDLINVVLCGKDEASAGLINIMSYDLLVKKINDVQQTQYNIIIVDECHFIKNPKTERTKAIVPLLKASSHVILVSGTPALSRPSELFTQISSINPKLFPSYHHYGIRYCAAFKNKFGWDYSGSSNMEELQIILEEYIMIRRLKKLVLDQLPSKTREIVYLDPSLIKEKSLLKSEKQLVQAKMKDKRSALLEYFSETCAAKAAAVREYIVDLLEGGHKLIVFAHHREMLDVICEALVKKKIEYIRIDGRTPPEKRQFFCDQFQRDSSTRVAVLSVTAANTGLTLTEATCVVFAELFWNPGALVQGEDRAYRIGQKNSIVIHYLIAKKTADDYLWPLIQKKLDVLSEAGLNKESFSDLEAKTFQDPKQRNLKVLFESMIEEFKDEDSLSKEFVESGSAFTTNTEVKFSGTRKDKAKVWKGPYDENASCSREQTIDQKCEDQRALDQKYPQTSSSSGECSHGSKTYTFEDEWFEDIENDEWDDFSLDISDCTEEPDAKRKRF